MTNDAREPQMGNAELLDSVQQVWGVVVHLAASVLLEGSVMFSSSVLVGKKAGEYLVNNRFHLVMKEKTGKSMF